MRKSLTLVISWSLTRIWDFCMLWGMSVSCAYGNPVDIFLFSSSSIHCALPFWAAPSTWSQVHSSSWFLGWHCWVEQRNGMHQSWNILVLLNWMHSCILYPSVNNQTMCVYRVCSRSSLLHGISLGIQMFQNCNMLLLLRLINHSNMAANEACLHIYKQCIFFHKTAGFQTRLYLMLFIFPASFVLMPSSTRKHPPIK